MSRFRPAAAERLRHAIREAGGVEVFAIGDVEDGVVTSLVVTCRGLDDRVPALLDRPRMGQVVIHNHPSGVLLPSDADLHLAGIYGDDGVGMVIVDSAVTRSNWVVEPHVSRRVAIDPDDVRRFFEESLPRALPDAEPRAGQVEMALEVARCFDEERPLTVEAGTGTGKSLAYLVPAALWALGNDGRVVISTYTKALQAQLHQKDLPLLARAGLEVRTAVLLGRNNYVCKRRLALAVDEGSDDPEEQAAIASIASWEATSADGVRGDFPDALDPALWERVESDSDLTLRVRCGHYASCRYYAARRNAAGAHLVVVNHSLLLSDLAVRGAGGAGVLPKYGRLVLDEAHHLEDAATGAISQRLSWRGLQRSIAPLLGRRGKGGALDRVVRAHGSDGSAIPAEERDALRTDALTAADGLRAVRGEAGILLETLASHALDPSGHPRRVMSDEDAWWTEAVRPAVDALAGRLEAAAGALDRVLAPFDDLPIPGDRAQPVLDARRGRRRILGYAGIARAFLEVDDNVCRWMEASTGRSDVRATLVVAPIDVAPLLRGMLWEKVPGAASTSATLAVAGRFEPWRERIGLDDAAEGVHPSPFDHATQALLAMPRDLPVPDEPSFLAESARCVIEAVRHSRGGAFVLCTSYDAVRHYAAALRDGLPASIPVLAQDGPGRTALVQRFLEHPDAVLVGTDSFWEGVDVKGDRLRLVVIPRLPFRVPTDPLQQARHERIQRRGGDPFRAYTLPQAILKLRQGYGRLIRSRSDKGVVLLLDRRVHDRPYGRIILHALPPARRLSAPWRRISEELATFFA